MLRLSVRRRFVVVAGSVAFLVALVGPALAPGDLAPRAAYAGQYSVYACDFAGGANNSWWYHADATMLVQSVCPSSGDADKGLGMLDDYAHPASRATNGARAQWSFLAPENSGIDAIRFAAHGQRQQWAGHSAGSSVWSVGLYGGWSRDPNAASEAMSACGGLTVCSLNSVGISTDTTRPAADRWVELFGRPAARFMVRCEHSSECFIDGSGVGAWLAVHGVQVLVGNWTPPWQGMHRDGAFDGGWKQGEVRATWDAYDDVSVKHQHLDIAGRRFIGRDYHCDYTNPRPCAADTVTASDLIDTRSLPDGFHSGNVAVTDAANNTANHGFTLRVDNHAPAKVSDLEVQGGDAWRSTNDFDVEWTNGDQGSGSPISGGRYQLCDAAGVCTEGDTSGLDRLSGLNVPADGEYTLRIAAVDAAGQGPWSDPVTLRYDDDVPGAAAPSHNNGWVNARQAKAYDQEIRLGQSAPRPASGIAGYSVAMDGADPDESVDAPGDPATYRVLEEQLTEGQHVFKARAVSRSGVASDQIGTTTIKVDLTAPSATIEGSPAAEWSSGPVTLRIQGVDQDHLSGMAGAEAEQPVERGAYLSYKIDDQPVQKVRGAEAAVRVEGDGVHTVTY
jgi:hypothetical protein